MLQIHIYLLATKKLAVDYQRIPSKIALEISYIITLHMIIGG